MTIRITGMASGLDTESIIRELTSVDKKNVTKVKNEQKRLEMKQEKWKALNKKVVSFYNKALSNLRFDGGYAKKATTLSKDNVASVTGSSNAMNGTQTLKVESLASAAYMTGGKVKTTDGSAVRLKADEENKLAATTMEDLGVYGKQDLKFDFGKTGESMTVEVNGTDTVADVVSKINSAASDGGFKVRANFDEKQQRLYLSSTTTGADASFSVDAANSGDVAQALGLVTSDDITLQHGARLTNTAGSSDLTSATPMWKLGGIDRYATGNKTLKFNYTDANGDAQSASVSIGPNDTINDVVSRINGDGRNIGFSFDAENQRFLVNNKGFSIDVDNSDENLAKSMGLINADKTSALEKDTSGVGSYKAGTDAKIYLNEVEYTSNSNNFEINGLTIQAKEVGDTTITTQDDTSGVYDMIKSFISEYNDLINEMTTLYSADRNKDFDFLTSEQKEEMTDEEIEDWNKKIDESIMSKDQTLGKVLTAMRQTMLSSYDLTDKDGKTTKVSLSTFNINTLSYFEAEANERAAYHIAGDEDDEYSSGKTAIGGTMLLKDAIANDPQLVQSFFKSLSKDLYSKLGDMMKSTDFSSSFTLYEDKLMKKNYETYKTKIKSAEDKLASREDAYYKQFAQMEKAMTNLNSQQSALGGMVG